MMNTKRWFHSKTIWTNLLVVIAMILADVAGVEWLDIEGQLAIIGVINLILRAITKQGLG